MGRSRRRRSRARGRRPGFALVAALSLMALSAALLVGALAISSAQARSARTERATLDAESRARYVLATALDTWGRDFDSLSIGQGFERELLPSERGMMRGAMPAAGLLRAHRLSKGVYVVAVDVSVGSPTTLARQRLRLLVSRPEHVAPADSTTAAVVDSGTMPARVRGAPTPISRWSVADLY